LKNKRFIIIVGTEITFNIITDSFEISIIRLTWTDLIRNGLNYLIINNYMDTSNCRTRQIYAIFKEIDINSLLDVVNIIIDQLEKYRQFPT
jgi:hypothetical protein